MRLQRRITESLGKTNDCVNSQEGIPGWHTGEFQIDLKTSDIVRSRVHPPAWKTGNCESLVTTSDLVSYQASPCYLQLTNCESLAKDKRFGTALGRPHLNQVARDLGDR